MLSFRGSPNHPKLLYSAIRDQSLVRFSVREYPWYVSIYEAKYIELYGDILLMLQRNTEKGRLDDERISRKQVDLLIGSHPSHSRK